VSNFPSYLGWALFSRAPQTLELSRVRFKKFPFGTGVAPPSAGETFTQEAVA
jgi:hypothetical protein